jgi:hypothetical protein
MLYLLHPSSLAIHMILIAADRHHRINRVLLLENQNRTILEAAKILDKVENQSCNLGFKKRSLFNEKIDFWLNCVPYFLNTGPRCAIY